jgi:hypothetical protein
LIKKEVRGSYTVEAAFLFPTVLFVIIALIYMGFYLHDKASMNSTINETMLKGKNLLLNDTNMNSGLIDYDTYLKRGVLYSLEDNLGNKKNEIYDYINTELSSGLLIATINQINVTVTYSNITIEVNSTMNLPFLEVKKYFTGTGTQVNLKSSAEVSSIPEFIRIFDVFSGVAEKIPLVNEVLQKLQQILNKVK